MSDIQEMKTLHLGIITVVGIVVIIMTVIGVFVEKLGGDQQPYSTMEINNMKENYAPSEPISFSVMVGGYGSGCGATKATIIKENDSQYKSPTWSITPQCAAGTVLHYFKFNSLSENTSINQTGNYILQASFNDMMTLRNSTMVEKFSILPGHTSIHDTTLSSDNATYLSQTVDEWKNKTYEQLNVYYKKYKDAFYYELGSFLIKDEMKKELARQNIQNIHDDFKVFPGITLESLPPHISYNAVVNATDGNSYLLLGGVFANKIESLKITKLVFDKDALQSISTGKRPSYANPFANAHVNNSTFQEGQKIAGIYVEDSDIPWSSAGTGNYGVIEISLYASVYHMIPDAQKYYTARAIQLIPFYIPVKILPPPFTEK